MASTFGFSRQPQRTMFQAPAWGLSGLAASSAGWKISLTVPGNLSRFSQRMRATVSRFVMWMSWPQACMTPEFSEAKATPVSSGTGRASMSARMPMHLPGPLAPWIRATTPVSNMRSMASTPYSVSFFSISSAVRYSL